MQIDDELIDALRELRDDQLDDDGNPPMLTWNGEAYPCITGDRNTSKQLQIAGFSLDLDKTFIIIADDLTDNFNPTAETQLGKQVAFKNAKFRITKFGESPGGSFIVLGCNDWAKGV